MNVYGTDHIVCPLMDARRSQVYTGIYRFLPEETSQETSSLEVNFKLDILEPQCVVPIETIAEKLNALPGEDCVVFLGDGVPVFREKLAALMHRPYTFAPALCNRQRASAVAVLAQTYARLGKMESAADHVPEYLRPSQAERERSEAQKTAGDKAGDAMMRKGTYSRQQKLKNRESGET